MNAIPDFKRLPKLPDMLSTSHDKDEAQQQFLQGLTQYNNITGQQLDNFAVESIRQSAPKLKAWSDDISEHTGKNFNAQEVLLKNLLLSGSYRDSTHSVIISDFASVPLKKPVAGIRKQEIWSGITTFDFENGNRLSFLTSAQQLLEKKGEYTNSFDFLGIEPKPPGKLIIKTLGVPYQSIDYRITAALNDNGLLHQFSNQLAGLIDDVDHDFVHSALKNNEHADINRLVSRINDYRSGSLVGEELWALGTHAAVYERIKDDGYAQRMADHANELVATIREFEAHSTDPNKGAMAESLRDIVGMHLSNFVDRAKIDAALHDPKPGRFEKLFSEGRPGNSTDMKLPVSDRHGPKPLLNLPLRLSAALHLTKSLTFPELSADSFAAVEKEFTKHPELAAPLSELRHAVSSGLRSDFVLSSSPARQMPSAPDHDVKIEKMRLAGAGKAKSEFLP